VASSPDVPLDPSRIAFEAEALRLLGPGGPLAGVASPAARPPRLLAFDPARRLLVVEDLGEAPDLGRWLWDGAGDAEAAGRDLGAFVGRLHAAGHSRREALRATLDNAAVQRTRLEVQYRAVGPALARAGVADAAGLGQAAVALGERLLEPGRCLVMGDLWPPSVLVTAGGLRLIDWELAHVGQPAQDLGHLAAHLWMRAHRAPDPAAAGRGRAALAAALAAYREALGGAAAALLDAATRRAAGLHFGCEVVARTVGPFQAGYLYEALRPGDAPLDEATAAAAAALRAPEAVESLGPLGG